MSNNKKEIINNIVSFGSIDIIGILIPIITMPILTRAIGVEGYGEYILLITILMFGHTFIDYGTQYIGVRAISKNRNNINQIKNIFSRYQSIRLFFLIIYSISLYIYSFYFLDRIFNQYILIYGIPYLLGYYFTSTWFFQGMGLARILLYFTLIGKLSNLIIIIFFVKNNDDIYLVLASTTWSTFISGVFLIFILKNKYNINLFQLKELKSTIVEGKNVFLGILAPNFYNAIPIIALGTISNPIDFAKFAIANRLCSIIITGQNILSRSVFPILARYKESYIIKLLLSNLIISIPIVIIISIWGNKLLTFFLGQGFSDGNIYLLILSIGVIFLGISNTYGEGFLLPKKYDQQYRNISLLVSILSAFICYILVFQYGLLGAAIAITIARVLFALGFYLSYFKVKNEYN